MMQEKALRQRVAVVDCVQRTREHARRAVRGLGHAPLVFTDVDELLAVGRSKHRYALMCFGIPSDAQDIRQLVEASKDVIGREVPVMFVASEGSSKALKDLGRIRRDETLVIPSSFADLYNAVEGFMIRQGMPLAEDGLAWGPYRFFPGCTLAKVSGADVWLDSPEFELAMELFHNVDRPLSSEWLRNMVPKSPARGWARWLDSRVDQLRRELALGSARNWNFSDARCNGYRLTSTEKKTPAPSSFAIERCFQA